MTKKTKNTHAVLGEPVVNTASLATGKNRAGIGQNLAR